jgi:P-type Cu2+ transporter
MDLEGVSLSGLCPRRAKLAARGRAAIVAAVDGHAVAVLGLADAPCDTADATIRALHELDVRVVMQPAGPEHVDTAVAKHNTS